MKKLSYEEWMKNPTPRMMWCWNEDEMYKVKRKVVYVLRDDYARVITIDDDDSDYELYNHCAEIGKQRRMTHKELSRWLREKQTRECKQLDNSNDSFVYSIHTYLESNANKEVGPELVIREDDSDWREPLVEV